MAMPHRFPHIMKKHISNKMPANILVFDTETHDKLGFKKKNVSRQILNFGYCYHTRYVNGTIDKEKWTRFTTSEQFFAAVYDASEDRAPLYCFAHNLSFDLTILDFWAWTEQQDFNVDYFVDSDPPTFIVGKWKGRKIVFVDTLNYWRNSLEDIGKSIGFEKLPRPDKSSTKKYWEVYGKRDVEVLHKALTNLMDYLHKNDLGQWGLSAASMAMSTYKHRFMTHDIYVHDNRHAMSCERQAYFGGLADCFFVGKVANKTLYKLDVNSMYPYVMLGKFPTKLVAYDCGPNVARVQARLREFGVIAKVEVHTNSTTYPVRYNDRLCYCKGKFMTFLCGPELKTAINNGHISKIMVANYYEMNEIFTDYVKFFWEERLKYKAEGNNVGQYFVKIFMNSLYGKFGQLGYDSCILTTDKLKELYEEGKKDFPDCYKDLTPLLDSILGETHWQPLGLGRSLTLRRLNNHVTVKVPNGEHNESFPGIAAYVTSYARSYLWELICCSGPRNTYYVDTDSLIVTKQGYDNLKQQGHCDDKAIGKLKLEEECKNSYFNGPKDYGYNGKVVLKGVKKKAELIAPNTYQQLQFEGLKGVINRGGENYIDVTTVVKKLSRNYNKGNQTSLGWIEPFTLPGPLDNLPQKVRSAAMNVF